MSGGRKCRSKKTFAFYCFFFLKIFWSSCTQPSPARPKQRWSCQSTRRDDICDVGTLRCSRICCKRLSQLCPAQNRARKWAKAQITVVCFGEIIAKGDERTRETRFVSDGRGRIHRLQRPRALWSRDKSSLFSFAHFSPQLRATKPKRLQRPRSFD